MDYRELEKVLRLLKCKNCGKMMEWVSEITYRTSFWMCRNCESTAVAILIDNEKVEYYPHPENEALKKRIRQLTTKTFKELGLSKKLLKSAEV